MLEHAGGVHALQTKWLAPEPASPEQGACGQTDTRAQDTGLTLQQPHEEPGAGHEDEMGRRDVREQRGDDRQEAPG